MGLLRIWRKEFEGYNTEALQHDVLAGVTVAAVALPLALAFGVASGATAAAGLAALETLIRRVEKAGNKVYLSGLNDPVRAYLERAGVLARLGEEHVFWNAYEAIIAADYRRAGLIPQAVD